MTIRSNQESHAAFAISSEKATVITDCLMFKKQQTRPDIHCVRKTAQIAQTNITTRTPPNIVGSRGIGVARGCRCTQGREINFGELKLATNIHHASGHC